MELVIAGLGRMGGNMARRLHRAGHRVIAASRHPANDDSVAADLFDLAGNILMVSEDVGRHNALDKLVGAALNEGMISLQQHILLLSGRASFELVQKATMAGLKVIVSVGAPSSLAVQTADEFGITLIGFAKRDKFNIYCNSEIIKA